MARVLSREAQKPQQRQRDGVVWFLLLVATVWFGGATILLFWHPQGNNHEGENDFVSPHLLVNNNKNPSIRKQQRLAELKRGHFSGPYLKPYESPLLIFTCARGEYLERTLDSVYQNYRSKHCEMGCPIVISQDGTDTKVNEVITKFQAKFATVDVPLVHLQHEPPKLRGPNAAYKKLAVHYGWALQQVFSGQYVTIGKSYFENELFPNPKRIVILEEDIEIAVDFFEYMSAMAPILDTDSNLLAVSAFNDNGFSGKVLNTTRVLRSDFFPGLGWMMTSGLWETELQSKWPDQYWDDWLREPAQRKGRLMLRPEVSRTFHFGTKGGASSNQFGNRLSSVQLNTDATVQWQLQHLQYIQTSAMYTEYYWNAIKDATPTKRLSEAMNLVKQGNVQLEYSGLNQFAAFARELGLMSDEKAGVPRTAYKGVVETRPFGQHLLFLIPSPLPSLALQFGMRPPSAETER